MSLGRVITFFVMLSLILYIAGHVEGYTAMQVKAIEHGYALYCPADGNFAWNGECDE